MVWYVYCRCTGIVFLLTRTNSLEFLDSNCCLFRFKKFVVQVGELPSHSDPPDELSTFYNRAHMMTQLNKVGFHTVQTYAEGHCHFFAPWQFLVAFKNIHTSVNWFRNEAQVEVQLHQRLFRTISGKPILQYFDGHIMRDYQVPPKVITTNNFRSTAKENGLKCSASKKKTTTPPMDGFVSAQIHRT